MKGGSLRTAIFVIFVFVFALCIVLSTTTGDSWVQTDQLDFDAGERTRTDTFSDPGNVTLSSVWNKHPTEYVLDVGPPAAWDRVMVKYPSVLEIGGTYHMWYTGNDGTNNRIGHATSTDGIQWTKDPGNPVLNPGPPGSWDASIVYYSSVIYNGTGFQMWYTGDEGTVMKIGYATSPDGVTWTKHPGNPVLIPGAPGSFDDVHVYHPEVLFDGLIYHMWYNGNNGGEPRIGYANSTDGITWNKYSGNPVLDLGPPGSWDDVRVRDASVYYNGSIFQMWYSGAAGVGGQIGHAVSADGINWNKNTGNPVLQVGIPGSWDDVTVYTPNVLYNGSTYKMWYTGYDGGSSWKIGYAQSSDGLVWQKYPTFPVLEVGTPGSWDDFYVWTPRVVYDGSVYHMWYSGDDGSTGRIGYANSTDGMTWIKYAGNPVMGPGAPGSFEEQSVYVPSVVYKDGIFHMWYTGYDFSNVYRFGYANSSDGITWNRYSGNPVLDVGPPGSWDDLYIHACSVIFNGTQYEMWYSGYDGTDHSIGYANSTDGLTWTKSPSNPVLTNGSPGSWDDTYVWYPTVFYNETSLSYQMWYIGETGSVRKLGYATSQDGATWTKYENNPILDIGPSGNWDDNYVNIPCVRYYDSTYHLWYTGFDGSNFQIGYAASKDGRNWTKHPSNYVLDVGPPAAWDNHEVYKPSVVFDGATYHMWYTGNDGSVSRIGYATSSDGLTWTKYGSNPVFDLGSPGAWDDGSVFDPMVILDGGTYRMWYAGHDGSNTNYMIGYATSADGIAWTRHPSNPLLSKGPPGSWEDYLVHAPIIRYTGSAYQMWYAGHDGTHRRTGYATSPDGVSWTKYGSNPVLDLGSSGSWDDYHVLASMVLHNGSSYNMWFAGGDGSGYTAGYATSSDGITWNKYAANPVLDVGLSGAWDESWAASSTVLYDDISLTYHMWYTGRIGSTSRIGYAYSPDGIIWQKCPTLPVLDLGLAGEWDAYRVTSPSVVYDGATYHMWYSGHDSPGGNIRIGHATSLDGYQWTRIISNPVLSLGPPGSWDDWQVYAPSVIYNGSGFEMWYSGSDGNYVKIGYATSPDGTIWTKYNDPLTTTPPYVDSDPVLDAGSPDSFDYHNVFHPSILYDGLTYHMWYTGYNLSNSRIGYATSPDGTTWTKYPGNPVLDLGPPGSWDDFHASAPTVHYDGSVFQMWYSGHDGSISEIGYANSPDGINWTKNPGNPVMSVGLPGTWEGLHVNYPTVLFDGSIYRMWYTGSDGSTPRIGYAEMGYQRHGTFVSSVFDSGDNITLWQNLQWTEYLPPGTDITMSTRTGNTSVPEANWSAWSPEVWDETGSPLNHPRSRYIQYRVTLTTDDPRMTPVLSEVDITFFPNHTQPPSLSSPANNTVGPNNQPTFTWVFNDPEGDSQEEFWVDIDDDPLFGSIDHSSGNITSILWQWTPGVPISDGVWFWRVKTMDEYGYWSDWSESWIITIDTTPPEAFIPMADPPSWTNSTQPQITFSTTDTLSGVDHYEVRIDTGGFTTQTSPYIIPPQSDGIHNITVRALDAAGNSRDGYVEVFIDTTPPAAPLAVAAIPDTWTNINSFSVNWTYPSEVDTSGIKSGAWYKIGGPPVDNSDGTWQGSKPITVTSIEGTQTIYLWLEDNVGNRNYTLYNTTVLYLDVTPPDSFIPIANPGSWTNNTQPEITFSTTDTPSGIDYYRVKIDSGGFTTQNSPYTLPPLFDGTHNITVRAYDLAGNYRDGHVDVFIDTNPPELFTPTANPSSWTNNTQPEIIFSTTDSRSGIDHYEVLIDAGGFTTQTSPYTLPVQADGTHNIIVRAFDMAGNYWDGSVEVFIDTTPPGPFTPIANPGSWTNDTQPEITFSTADSPSGIDHYEVQIDSGTFTIQTSPYTLPVQADGTHNIIVRAFDLAGNHWDSSVQVFIDTIPPAAPLDVAVIPDTWTNINSFSLNWTYPSEIDTSGIRSGAWYKIGSPPVDNSDGTWQGSQPITVTSIEGTQTIYLWLEDNVGNRNCTFHNTTVFYLDMTPPDVFSPMADPASWTNNDQPEITFSTTDTPSGIDRYEVRIDGGGFTTHTSPYTLPAQTEGVHNITVRAFDLAGNSRDGYVEVFIDTIPPNVFTPTAEPASWTNNTQPEITFTTTDAVSGVGHYEVQIDSGSFATRTSPYTLSVLGDGVHSITVRAHDLAGNYRDGYVEVFIDTTPPDSFTPIADPDSWTTNNQPGISFSTTDAGSGISHYEVQVDSGTFDTQTSPHTLPAQVDGTHAITVRAYDNAGNYREGTVDIYIDTTPPEAPSGVSAVPNSWTGSNSFAVDWTVPSETDTSGIKTGAWYKIGSAPASNSDGTWTGNKPVTVTSFEGEQVIYVWLEDNLGNVDYTNHDTTILYLDTTPPAPPTGVAASPGNWTITNSFSIDWINPEDDSGVATGAWYKIGTPPSSDSDGTWLAAKPITITSMEGEQTVYVWLRDNMGNCNHLNHSTVVLRLDSTAPSIVHTAVTKAEVGRDITISASVTDNVVVKTATLYYRKQGDGSFTTATMSNVGDVYSANIPASYVTSGGVEYYISASDEINTASYPSSNAITAPQAIEMEEDEEPFYISLWWLFLLLAIVLIILFLLLALRRDEDEGGDGAIPQEEPVYELEEDMTATEEEPAVSETAALPRPPRAPIHEPVPPTTPQDMPDDEIFRIISEKFEEGKISQETFEDFKKRYKKE